LRKKLRPQCGNTEKSGEGRSEKITRRKVVRCRNYSHRTTGKTDGVINDGREIARRQEREYSPN